MKMRIGLQLGNSCTQIQAPPVAAGGHVGLLLEEEQEEEEEEEEEEWPGSRSGDESDGGGLLLSSVLGWRRGARGPWTSHGGLPKVSSGPQKGLRYVHRHQTLAYGTAESSNTPLAWLARARPGMVTPHLLIERRGSQP
ncbi:unnamed protein product [Prorocentrum cordatum]|uniref:Uncharacterized protein n=1 Tax=Prorocentrum cordatum TaxID=2364126 RepID=A0ABN9XL10_9DINO|nr:unnamed protein product [Polarella glacialis]